LQTQLAPDVYHVKADPAQIEQVLLNLVVNARDAMPQGGKLTIRTANANCRPSGTVDPVDPVDPGDAGDGPLAVLEVTDTGCGMDDATKARIFEPFFTTKGKDRGTGMGLSTVYGIVKQCGGTVTVESQPGRGTTFKIFLPRARDALLPRQIDAPPEPVPCGSETALVVDDESSVRQVVSAILRVRGYTILEAGSGREALEACQRHAGTIDLIISDVIMPEMSGQELADRVAALHPRIKLLLMSGYAGEQLRARGSRHREPAFLHKPFTSDALARKVRQVLDG
jgi:two-component system cell cycle sensor histidine kinase/response regulator CckA